MAAKKNLANEATRIAAEYEAALTALADAEQSHEVEIRKLAGQLVLSEITADEARTTRAALADLPLLVRVARPLKRVPDPLAVEGDSLVHETAPTQKLQRGGLAFAQKFREVLRRAEARLARLRESVAGLLDRELATVLDLFGRPAL